MRSPTVKSSNRDGTEYIKAYKNERDKKVNKRTQRKGRGIKDFRKERKNYRGPRRESAQGVGPQKFFIIKMTFKILRDKSKPFINFETIIEDLVQVSPFDSAIPIGNSHCPIRISKTPLLVSNCFCGEKSQ